MFQYAVSARTQCNGYNRFTKRLFVTYLGRLKAQVIVLISIAEDKYETANAVGGCIARLFPGLDARLRRHARPR